MPRRELRAVRVVEALEGAASLEDGAARLPERAALLGAHLDLPERGLKTEETRSGYELLLHYEAIVKASPPPGIRRSADRGCGELRTRIRLPKLNGTEAGGMSTALSVHIIRAKKPNTATRMPSRSAATLCEGAQFGLDRALISRGGGCDRVSSGFAGSGATSAKGVSTVPPIAARRRSCCQISPPLPPSHQPDCEQDGRGGPVNNDVEDKRQLEDSKENQVGEEPDDNQGNDPAPRDPAEWRSCVRRVHHSGR